MTIQPNETEQDRVRVAARLHHGEPGLVEVDTKAEVLETEEGFWVAAWLFVTKDEVAS